MNDGKKLEQLVRFVQETLKNVPDTEIFYRVRSEDLPPA